MYKMKDEPSWKQTVVGGGGGGEEEEEKKYG